jgi:hypothetical protein
MGKTLNKKLGFEDSHGSQTMEIAYKEAKKKYQKSRAKVLKAVKNEATSERDALYQLYVKEAVARNLKIPLRKNWDDFKAERDAILNAPTSEAEKIPLIQDLVEKLDRELQLSVQNALAVLEKMTAGKVDLTRKGIAKLLVTANVYTEMMTTGKGRALSKIYDELTKSRELHSDDWMILEESFLDPERSNIAFFALLSCKEGVQMQFAEKFVKTHPDLAADFIDRGNCKGIFTSNDVKKLLEAAQKKDPTNKKVALEIKDFDKYEKIYNQRYNAMQGVQKTYNALLQKDQTNPALKKLTFKGVGRVIGYGASIMTIFANVVANRSLFMKDPVEALKNPYLWGGVGGLTYLRYTDQGKKIKDFFTGSGTREQNKREKAFGLFNELLGYSNDWAEFLETDGAPGFIYDYKKHLKNKTVGRRLSAEGFLDYLKANEVPKKNKPKLSDKFQEVLTDRGSKKATEDLGTFMAVFTELRVSTDDSYKEALNQRDEAI